MASVSRSSTIVRLLAASTLAWAAPNPKSGTQSLDVEELGLTTAQEADSEMGGYLGAFFLGDDPYVYLYLSNGNDALSFSALNGGDPVIIPTTGTGGVRDPAIVTGGGDEAGQKWYIVGTDLDIAKTTWGAAQANGSLGIYVWESTDLINWTDERLVVVEEDTAGMVWAPEAVWDPSEGKYLVHWASKFYADDDTGHTGTPTTSQIRYAHTSDFRTFSEPKTYIDKTPVSVIDLNILPYQDESDTYLRFIKDEGKTQVFVEVSTTGLFGEWTRPGGDDAYIRGGVEGPASYWDNKVAGQAHLLVDYYGADGYHPVVNDEPDSNSGWTNSSQTNFPTHLRHGGVISVTAAQMDALSEAWA